MIVSVFILRGGILPGGTDGAVSSAGMDALGRQLAAIKGVTVSVYNWGDWRITAMDIWHAQLAGHKIVLIGYSGGGSRATMLACLPNKPHIDLMVCYDPSPAWQMFPRNQDGKQLPLLENVVKAYCFHNTTPMMFGLGGGELIGLQVYNFDIAEQHLLVQFDQRFHDRTIGAIRSLLTP